MNKMDKTLLLIAIILLLLGGFTVEINKFKFEWIGLLEKALKILK